MNENPPTKQCSKCKETKPLEMFVASKNRKDGRHSLCIPCNRIRLTEYRKAHPDRIRAAEKKYLAVHGDVKAASRKLRQKRYAELHCQHGPSVTEKICPHCKALKPADGFFNVVTTKDGLSARCKNCASEDQKQRRKDNPETYARYDKERWSKYDKEPQRQAHRAWREKNRTKRNAYRMRIHKERAANDVGYRFSCRIRTAVFHSLRGDSKYGYTEQLLGCTIVELRKYLESQFEPWMNWDNWGRGPGTWNVDHVIPVSAFDMSKSSEQLLCWNFTNLRPLSWEKNISKSDTHDPADLDKLRASVQKPNS